jgi:hypothetical protein
MPVYTKKSTMFKRCKKRTVAHPLQIPYRYQTNNPKSFDLRNNSHEGRPEEQRNKSKTRLRDWLVHNGRIVSRGCRSAGAGTGACASRGRLGASGSGSCIQSGVTENIVVVPALAADAGLELLDILALGETVDAAVAVVLVGFCVPAALGHGIGDVTTNNGGAGCICCWDFPDAAAAGGACGADGGGCGGHFGVSLWFDFFFG